MPHQYSLYPTTSAVAMTMPEPLTPTSISTRPRSSTSTSATASTSASVSLSKGSKRGGKGSKGSGGRSAARRDWIEYEYPAPEGISFGGKERVPPAVAVLAPAFAEDPLLTYLLNSLDPVARRAYLPAYFTALLTQATLNGAYVLEHSSWESCMTVLPPGRKLENPFTLLQSGLVGVLRKVGLLCVTRMLGEFEGAVNKARKHGLAKGEVPYYVFFIGTRADCRGRGLGAELLAEVTKRAGQEGRSVWLEATTEERRRLFLRMGFVDVEEVVMGRGKVGPRGYEMVGGPGVRLWCMVWRKGDVVVKIGDGEDEEGEDD
ncbi:hypothetical protein VC83_08488 [Pseudogymnoascus destructans]|uniref:N-acetyltransferase domain-containing protein n=2 Tax=Pseudogymnoascus destructans TaxID=655981 RepID=L8G143_PSED2|nr:uncharacterized protein VC83_08488 [Pseudogymnoascus destructans]ELR06499.1 hypothetical protein GMDG_08023 [Pseudogymnoascus destructans 20631-21]OAF55126.2 hypothetical protein VC83_08488 [Pseudogymnoascus destructans]